ncbi:MAG: DedA family protein [Nitrospirae bacterium]|nr:MAG: DedA family protein [Nitrospirota bacterium]
MEELQSFLLHYGYGLVVFGALVEGETVLILAGVLVHQGTFSFPLATAAAIVGAVVGDQVWFYLGRHSLQNIIRRFPRLGERLDRVRPWLERHADWIAAGSRFVYGTRIASPMVLGANGYSRGRFLVINILVGTIWVLLCITCGYLLGATAQYLFGEVARLEWLAIIVVLVILGWRFWVRQRFKTP